MLSPDKQEGSANTFDSISPSQPDSPTSLSLQRAPKSPNAAKRHFTKVHQELIDEMYSEDFTLPPGQSNTTLPVIHAPTAIEIGPKSKFTLAPSPIPRQRPSQDMQQTPSEQPRVVTPKQRKKPAPFMKNPTVHIKGKLTLSSMSSQQQQPSTGAVSSTPHQGYRRLRKPTSSRPLLSSTNDSLTATQSPRSLVLLSPQLTAVRTQAASDPPQDTHPALTRMQSLKKRFPLLRFSSRPVSGVAHPIASSAKTTTATTNGINVQPAPKSFAMKVSPVVIQQGSHASSPSPSMLQTSSGSYPPSPTSPSQPPFLSLEDSISPPRPRFPAIHAHSTALDPSLATTNPHASISSSRDGSPAPKQPFVRGQLGKHSLLNASAKRPQSVASVPMAIPSKGIRLSSNASAFSAPASSSAVTSPSQTRFARRSGSQSPPKIPFQLGILNGSLRQLPEDLMIDLKKVYPAFDNMHPTKMHSFSMPYLDRLETLAEVYHKCGSSLEILVYFPFASQKSPERGQTWKHPRMHRDEYLFHFPQIKTLVMCHELTLVVLHSDPEALSRQQPHLLHAQQVHKELHPNYNGLSHCADDLTSKISKASMVEGEWRMSVATFENLLSYDEHLTKLTLYGTRVEGTRVCLDFRSLLCLECLVLSVICPEAETFDVCLNNTHLVSARLGIPCVHAVQPFAPRPQLLQSSTVTVSDRCELLSSLKIYATTSTEECEIAQEQHRQKLEQQKQKQKQKKSQSWFDKDEFESGSDGEDLSLQQAQQLKERNMTLHLPTHLPQLKGIIVSLNVRCTIMLPPDISQRLFMCLDALELQCKVAYAGEFPSLLLHHAPYESIRFDSHIARHLRAITFVQSGEMSSSSKQQSGEEREQTTEHDISDGSEHSSIFPSIDPASIEYIDAIDHIDTESDTDKHEKKGGKKNKNSKPPPEWRNMVIPVGPQLTSVTLIHCRGEFVFMSAGQRHAAPFTLTVIHKTEAGDDERMRVAQAVRIGNKSGFKSRRQRKRRVKKGGHKQIAAENFDSKMYWGPLSVKVKGNLRERLSTLHIETDRVEEAHVYRLFQCENAQQMSVMYPNIRTFEFIQKIDKEEEEEDESPQWEDARHSATREMKRTLVLTKDDDDRWTEWLRGKQAMIAKFGPTSKSSTVLTVPAWPQLKSLTLETVTTLLVRFSEIHYEQLEVLTAHATREMLISLPKCDQLVQCSLQRAYLVTEKYIASMFQRQPEEKSGSPKIIPVVEGEHFQGWLPC